MKVAIQKLENGLHRIEPEEVSAVEIGLEESEFYPNAIIVAGEIDKFDQAYRLKLDIKSTAHYTCERCLDEYDKQIDEHTEQIYQEGAGDLSADDDVQEISADAIEIEVNDVIRDVFITLRPIRLICKENCLGLCPKCGVNLNRSSCKCETQEIDPRLEKLKSLLK